MRQIITKIDEITGNIATLKATGIALGELAEIESPGKTTLGQVIRLNQDNVTVQVFGGTKGISTSDRVRFLGHPMRVKYGNSLLGRIFNGSGVPIDGGPEPQEEDIAIGDYVILHVGYALQKLDAEEAQKTLALFAEMGAQAEAAGAGPGT